MANKDEGRLFKIKGFLGTLEALKRGGSCSTVDQAYLDDVRWLLDELANLHVLYKAATNAVDAARRAGAALTNAARAHDYELVVGKTCRACDGTGLSRLSSTAAVIECAACKGQGHIPVKLNTAVA